MPPMIGGRDALPFRMELSDQMIAFYDKYRLLIFVFLLVVSILITIFIFLNRNRIKYPKSAGYGYLIISISFVIGIIEIINHKPILSKFGLGICIIGFLVITAGAIKERYTNKS